MAVFFATCTCFRQLIVTARLTTNVYVVIATAKVLGTVWNAAGAACKPSSEPSFEVKIAKTPTEHSSHVIKRSLRMKLRHNLPQKDLLDRFHSKHRISDAQPSKWMLEPDFLVPQDKYVSGMTTKSHEVHSCQMMS